MGEAGRGPSCPHFSRCPGASAQQRPGPLSLHIEDPHRQARMPAAPRCDGRGSDLPPLLLTERSEVNGRGQGEGYPASFFSNAHRANASPRRVLAPAALILPPLPRGEVDERANASESGEGYPVSCFSNAHRAVALCPTRL